MSTVNNTLSVERGPTNESLMLGNSSECTPSTPMQPRIENEEAIQCTDVVTLDSRDGMDGHDGIIEALDKIGELCQHKNHEKKDSAIKHVTTFLQNHYISKHETYRNVKKGEDISYQMLVDEIYFFDRLATYFAEHARFKSQPPCSFIEYEFC